MATLLDDAALEAALAELDGWNGDGTAIHRTVDIDADRLDGFRADLESIAREMDHDPDLTGGAGQLTITMSTHSAGGVTELDIEYARRVNSLLA
ncbi:MAG TPA: 4a-hydroxytetrahydrobiopterin dehydratase [Mycobacteriales bacterium]|nr:4a-hydroxytetrahydrobiopterin dehydratase [Mycobacteriales bacterium]